MKKVEKLHDHHLPPNSYLHAASVIAPADTACRYGSGTLLLRVAADFATAGPKSNLFGTARKGVVSHLAKIVRTGRTAQVWGADVCNDGRGKLIALFRCKQFIIYPRAATGAGTGEAAERSPS